MFLPRVRTTRGFTVIELLVVILIIGILVSIAVVALRTVRIKARDAQRISDIKQIQNALEMYRNDTGYYPVALTGGSPLSYGSETYLRSVPSDPQTSDNPAGTGYIYIASDDLTSYSLSYYLSSPVADVPAGSQTAVPGQIYGATALNTTYGSGGDGDVTIASGSKDLSSDILAAGRSCADGVTYSVTALTATTATLSSTPASGCLATNDIVLLINLWASATTNFDNVGNYEFLQVSSVSSNVVTFSTNKVNYYGNNGGDTNISTAAGTQKVMLARVPQYNNLTINAGTTLTATAFNEVKGGVLTMKVKGTLTVNGTVTMFGKGYYGGAGGLGCGNAGYQGKTIFYGSAQTVNSNQTGNVGGGAGGGTNISSECLGGGGGDFNYSGCNAARHCTCYNPGLKYGGYGGCGYGANTLSKIFMGSGGGSGGSFCSAPATAAGGGGGGLVLLYANQLTVNTGGSIVNNGADGGSIPSNNNAGSGGGGSGGMIALRVGSYTLGTNLVTSTGGAAGGGTNHVGTSGGTGRIVIYYSGSGSGTTNPAATTSQQ